MLKSALWGGLFFSSQAMATQVDLTTLLDWAQARSESLQSVERQISSIEAEIKARDLVLSPLLEAEIAQTNDTRPGWSGSSGRSLGSASLLLTKPFASATELSVGVGQQRADEQHLGSWEIKISQDLWRNGFGRDTRLRRTGEQEEASARRWDWLAKKHQLLLKVETGYWSLLGARKEEQIRRSNLERAVSIEKWIEGRVRRSAAEPTDLLQAQALVAQRKLELLKASQHLEETHTQMRDLIPDSDPQSWQVNLDTLSRPRKLDELLPPSAGGVRRLDALATYYRSRQARTEALRTEDQLRPRLQAYLSHGQSGLDDTFNQAWGRASGSGTTIGIKLTMELDRSLKQEKRRAALLSAEATEWEARSLQRQSVSGYELLQKQIANLESQLEETRSLMRYKAQAAQAERARFEQGRTTAFQAISLEIEAAVAEMQLYERLSTLRQTEAQARLYTRTDEGVL